MGTAAYMSPEQASGSRRRQARGHLGVRRGAVRDARRQAAVRGRDRHRTRLPTCSARSIDWARLPATTPRADPPPAGAVSRARPRAPAARHRRGADRESSDSSSSGERPRSSAGSRRGTRGMAPVCPVAGARPRRRLLVAGVPRFSGGRRPARPPNLRMDVRLTDGGAVDPDRPRAGFAPDGTRVAFVTGTDATPQLHVRTLDQLDSATLAEGAGEGASPYQPFFSPDGAGSGTPRPGSCARCRCPVEPHCRSAR